MIEHEETPEAPGVNVQVAALKVPVELVEKLTVPVGVVALDDVSVTVAVHVVELPTVCELGEQLMPRVVVCPVTSR